VKEFVAYTALRVGMFAGSLAIVSGIWAVVAPDNSVPMIWAVVIAFVVSGVLSYKLLNSQREALARNVQTRAERASAKFEQMKAKEDTD
jgi:mannitol-specific phosphotransferase system IIBC component